MFYFAKDNESQDKYLLYKIDGKNKVNEHLVFKICKQKVKFTSDIYIKITYDLLLQL